MVLGKFLMVMYLLLNDEEGIQSTAKFTEQIIPLNFSPKQISWEQKEPEEMTIRTA